MEKSVLTTALLLQKIEEKRDAVQRSLKKMPIVYAVLFAVFVILLLLRSKVAYIPLAIALSYLKLVCDRYMILHDAKIMKDFQVVEKMYRGAHETWLGRMEIGPKQLCYAIMHEREILTNNKILVGIYPVEEYRLEGELAEKLEKWQQRQTAQKNERRRKDFDILLEHVSRYPDRRYCVILEGEKIPVHYETDYEAGEASRVIVFRQDNGGAGINVSWENLPSIRDMDAVPPMTLTR